MRIVSILENQKVEKRIAITPDIAKKYIALGFKISIVEKYGKIHLKDYITSFIKGWIIMKIKSSLKSLKKRDLNSKLVRRRGRVYIINKTNPKFKARQK